MSSHFAWWDAEKKLLLITEEVLDALPDGVLLESINGRPVVVGKGNRDPKSPNYIDLDTRGGFLAYGIRMIPPKEWAKRR